MAYEPAWHGAHTPAWLAPSVEAYVPPGQPVHAELLMAPTPVENEPAAQLTQPSALTTPRADEYVPRPHVEHVVDMDPEAYVPGQHHSQRLAPTAVEYVPTEQFWHPPGLVAPALAEYVPTPHTAHVDLFWAPCALE